MYLQASIITKMIKFLKVMCVDQTSYSISYILSSAGVGRTGTYIAMDYLLDQAATEGVVDVPGCVNKLRECRIHMVQNVVSDRGGRGCSWMCQ